MRRALTRSMRRSERHSRRILWAARRSRQWSTSRRTATILRVAARCSSRNSADRAGAPAGALGKFGPGGAGVVGAVSFGSGDLGHRARIRVTRQGILGLEPADARHVVDVFARGEVLRMIEGCGIDAHLVRRLRAEEHEITAAFAAELPLGV